MVIYVLYIIAGSSWSTAGVTVHAYTSGPACHRAAEKARKKYAQAVTYCVRMVPAKKDENESTKP